MQSRTLATLNKLCHVAKKSFGSRYDFEKDIPKETPRKKMNLFQAVNDAMDIVLATDKT